MKRSSLILGLPLLAVFAGTPNAAEKKIDSSHVKKDIAAHRAMAEAHLQAAKCLEAGTPEKECQAQLAKDCKGLGIGKYCGLQHRH